MNGSTKRDREKSLSRAMMVLAALVLVAGLFFQISMRADCAILNLVEIGERR